MSFDVTIYLFVVLGILINLVQPILWELIPKPNQGTTAGAGGWIRQIYKAVKPYVATLLFALITAPLIMAILGERLAGWEMALLAGFAWQSVLQQGKTTIDKYIETKTKTMAGSPSV